MAPRRSQVPAAGHTDGGDPFVVVHKPRAPSQNDLPEVFRLPTYNGHDLYEVTVHELQHLYSSGALSSVDYVKLCLDRIQRVKTRPFLPRRPSR